MARVCKPGGEVLIINQFARDRGALAMAERAAAPFADLLGWHSDFAIDRVLGEMSLVLEEKRPLPSFGMFTFLRQRKGDRLNFLRSSGRHFRSSSIDLTGRQT